MPTDEDLAKLLFDAIVEYGYKNAPDPGDAPHWLGLTDDIRAGFTAGVRAVKEALSEKPVSNPPVSQDVRDRGIPITTFEGW